MRCFYRCNNATQKQNAMPAYPSDHVGVSLVLLFELLSLLFFDLFVCLNSLIHIKFMASSEDESLLADGFL
jgi:hypothetical protein